MPAVILPRTPQLGDAGRTFAQEALDRGGSQSHHDLGLHQIDLTLEPRNTSGHFLGSGFAVPGRQAGSIRTAFQDVGDEHRIASQPHGGDDLGEQFARLAHEGLSAEIFFGPGSLSDEQNPGLEITDPENDRTARTHQMGAAGAGKGLLAQEGHRPCALFWRQRRWESHRDSRRGHRNHWPHRRHRLGPA
jgi:hypothetical protein